MQCYNYSRSTTHAQETDIYMYVDSDNRPFIHITENSFISF